MDSSLPGLLLRRGGRRRPVGGGGTDRPRERDEARRPKARADVAHLAEAHLLAGDAEKARELATLALEAARARGERAHEAYALRILGCAVAGTSTAEARRHLRAAFELADELGMRPLAAQARLDLAFVDERHSGIAVRDAAAETTRLLESMAMRDWLARKV